MGAAEHGLAERLPVPAATEEAAEAPHKIDLLEVRSRKGPGVHAEVGQQPPVPLEMEGGGEVGAMEMGLAGAEERVGRRDVGTVGVRLRRGASARGRARHRDGRQEKDRAQRPGQPQLQSFWIMTSMAVTLAALVLQLVRLPRTCTLAPGLRLALQSLPPFLPLHL